MFPGAIAATAPDRAAIIMANSGQTISFGELDEGANRLSNVLRDSGLQPGDHIALCLENHPRYFEILWGCHYAGLIYTACSSRLTTDELSYIINDCQAKAFITSKYKVDQAREVLSTTPNVALRLMLDGSVDGYDSYEKTVAGASAEPLAKRLDGVDMLYSSGTTGRPKGIKLGLPMTELGSPTSLSMLCSMLFNIDQNTVYLSPAPLYHAAPLRFTMTTHRLGGTTIIMEHFDPTEYLRLVEQHKVTHSQLVPTMFVRMLKLDDTTRDKFDTSSLKCAIHAAA
ncbi:MAG: AMP-binding protein, partial [Actinomycetota bacterium]